MIKKRCVYGLCQCSFPSTRDSWREDLGIQVGSELAMPHTWCPLLFLENLLTWKLRNTKHSQQMAIKIFLLGKSEPLLDATINKYFKKKIFQRGVRYYWKLMLMLFVASRWSGGFVEMAVFKGAGPGCCLLGNLTIKSIISPVVLLHWMSLPKSTWR